MVKSGDIIESIPTGERVIFRKTAAETDGSCVEFDLFVAPDGRPGAPHTHLTSQEKFEVLAGSITFYKEGEPQELQTGDTIIIPAGTPHDFKNLGGREVHMRGWVEPPHHFEDLMETFFALSAMGKTDKDGRPSLLQTVAILYRLRREYRVEIVPYWVQRFIFPILAMLARARGYTSTISYPEPNMGTSERA